MRRGRVRRWWTVGQPGTLGEDIADNLAALWPCQAMEAALVGEGQIIVFQSQQVQDRGVEVAEVNLALHGLGTGLVGAAVGQSPLHSASSQPEGESGRLVSGLILLVGWFKAGPSKLATPDHKGVLQKSPLIEVSKKGGDGSVSRFAVGLQVPAVVLVLIPAIMGNLDEAHSRFREAPGEKALASKVRWAAGAYLDIPADPVTLKGCF